MTDPRIRKDVNEAIASFGLYPFDYFRLLDKSDNPNLYFSAMNQSTEFIKFESWHSLKLATYYLWATTDNGEYIWYDGHQIIAMNARDHMFISVLATPRQFLTMVKRGSHFDLFPSDLVVQL